MDPNLIVLTGKLGELRLDEYERPIPQDPPTEFRLLAAGETPLEDRDRVVVVDEAAVTSIMAAYDKRNTDKLFVDYDHEFGRAAGWFELEVRGGDVWAANVKWTTRAAEMLRDGEYRFYSPAFIYEELEAGIDEWPRVRPLQMLNLALTNMPALPNLEPLMAAARRLDLTRGDDMAEKEQVREATPSAKLLEALALKSGATEDDVLVALRKQTDGLAKLEKELEVEGVDGILGAVQGLKAQDGQVEKLQKQVDGLLTAAAKRERDELVDQGMRDGRIEPALEEWARDESTPIATLKGYLDKAPKRLEGKGAINRSVGTEPEADNMALLAGDPAAFEKAYATAKRKVQEEWETAGRKFSPQELILEVRARHPELRGEVA